jgi:hypothetical protein
MFCKAPFAGITIDPSGWVTLCCNTTNRKYFQANINTIDSLKDIFFGEKFNDLRKTMSEEGFGRIPQCEVCINAVKGKYTAEYQNYNSRINEFRPVKLRYLELTASNICNQTCVTCSSYFSSKWLKLEQKMNLGIGGHNPPFILSKDSVDKIIEVLDDLEVLQIKGGEPTADKNNLKILRKLAEINPNCRVIIISNFQEISNEWWEVLSSLNNLEMSSSLDGIGETYDWIRGGDFNKTYDNMLKFKEMHSSDLRINPCVSLYNLFHLHELNENIQKDFTHIFFGNVVISPKHLSPHILQEKLLPMLESYYGKDYEKKYFITPGLLNMPSTFLPENVSISDLYGKFKYHTESMNKVRGVNIFELQPQLLDIFK